MRSGAALATAALALLAPGAEASDGVLEINQACATTTGCFAGDGAGYPVTITSGGSYRLTTNLVVPDATTDGITVTGASTSIDLNGFEIVRSACVGATTPCIATTGSGRGIRAAGIRDLSVTNGNITGMGFHGIEAGANARVTRVRVRWSNETGLNLGDGSIASENILAQNNFGGLYAGAHSNITGNVAYENGATGIRADDGSTVVRNTVFGNFYWGIFATSNATIAHNTVYENQFDGIAAYSGSTVVDNTSYSNSGDGIDTSDASNVQRNTVQGNAGYGLSLHSTTGYRGNIISGNTGGTVYSGLNLGANVCNGSLTCP